MSKLGARLRTAALRLVAAPGAVFLAVLTAGLATSSTARHSGLLEASAHRGSEPHVVLACPKSRAVNAVRAAASSSSAACRRSAASSASLAAADGASALEAANEVPRAEKHADAKSSGGGVSIPLPDFETPELSRFTSPL